MENSNSKAEREFSRRIVERDRKTPSPEERAGYIYNLIKDHNNDLTNWDLLCFCSEFLGAQVAVYDWLDVEAVKRIVIGLYEAHYLRNELPETGLLSN